MTTIYSLGNTQIDISERSIVIAGEAFSIEPKANALLKLLMDNAHKVVSRDEILTHVFPGQVVSYSSINRLVAILRKVFNHDPATTEYIKTIAKVGYKLQVSVNPLSSATQPLDKNTKNTPSVKSIYLNLLKKSHNLPIMGAVIAFTFVLVFVFLPKTYFTTQAQCLELSDWVLAGSNTTDYIGCLDENFGVPAPSAHISSKISSPDGFTSLLQGGWLEEYRGKKIKLSMQIKANNVLNHAGLFLRADAEKEGEPLAFINSAIAEDLIIHSINWTNKSLILDIPNETANLVYGIYLNGEGEIWMDNVNFEIVGEADSRPLKEAINESPKNLNFELVDAN
jgi:DNA-binding winged helix-turn-helix (wHTH) protein